MKKILFTTNTDWAQFNFRRPLAGALRREGCEVALVCPAADYANRLRSEGYRVLDWTLDRRSINPLRETTSIFRLARIYMREAPDVVHHFAVKPILYGSVAARLAGVRTVINTFTGLGFLFSDARSARRLRAASGPLWRWVLRSSSTSTLFHNESDRDRLSRLGIVSPRSAWVVPGSGVDVGRFAPRPPSSERRSREPIVLMAARMVLDKGVGEFVRAAKELREAGCRARFRFAGAPDPGNPTCVTPERLDEWRRAGDVEFLGHRDDMPELLRDADIAVLPSYHEGMPRFLLEAAACGLPLVASDIEACRKVVRNGVNGLLVRAGDAEGLRQAIFQLLKSVEARERMGAASRERAVREFSEERVNQDYLEVYRRLGILDGSRRPYE